MEMIDEILSWQNISMAIAAVKQNRGAAGVDEMTVDELEGYMKENYTQIVQQIKTGRYTPQPVRRVYIPKANGKQRPLGIPTVVDRAIQQAVAQKLVEVYEPVFSEYSYGFRPNRSCHTAMFKALEYLNDGYEWIVDLDIEKYFDTVNHDKLISILREQMNDSTTLHLIRSFLKAGVMEDGLTSPTEEGVPQGGPLSPVLSNIYLDKFDKELESRGLHFARYADDCNIFVKSEVAANRVMKSVTSWLERKLFLKVNATKTKVTRPGGGAFLGFGYWNDRGTWKCRPLPDRFQRLYDKCGAVLLRKRAVARPLAETFIKLNQIIRGWINYYRIGSMKGAMDEFGQWLRHKVRVVMMKQWKTSKTIYKKLVIMRKWNKSNLSDEELYKAANTRLGWYRRCRYYVVNYLLCPKALETPNEKEGRPGLVNPLEYYLAALQ